MVIVPNAKLAQSIITNYYKPDPTVNITITVGTSYAADPEEVERALKEEAQKAINELPGFVKSFKPIVRLQSFGDFSLNFLLVLQVENYDAQFAVWGELHKRIFKRFRQEGIEIPYPIRKVYLKSLNPTVDQDRSPKMG
jgi:small-conductance mechanosensitive channel